MGPGTTPWERSVYVRPPKILVVGCGGAGGNSVTRLHRLGLAGADTLVVNTDRVHMDAVEADRKLLIGGPLTRGMGAGGRPEIGERAAELSEREIRDVATGYDLTFVTVGMGGGTGTGAAPFVAELGQASGSVVITLATMPFKMERGRLRTARLGLPRLKSASDSLILLDNDRLLDLVPNLPVEQAFAVMDQLVAEVVKSVTDAINLPGLINLDFADVRTILQDGGTSTIFVGEGSDDDPDRVVADTLRNPLLNVDIKGAKGALIHLSSGPSLPLRVAHRVIAGLTAEMREDANVIFGVRVDPRLDRILRVLAITTGVRAPGLEAVENAVLDEVSPAARAVAFEPFQTYR